MINVLQHQRVSRRPVILRKKRSLSKPEKRRLLSLIKERPKLELVLVGTLILSICVPLITRLPAYSAGYSAGFHLPGPERSEVEKLFSQYLDLEKAQSPGKENLHPNVIKSLSLTTYQVKKGDTISGIAQKFRLNLDTVISYNNIRDARALKEGAVLKLPNTDGLKHRVKRGDYLGGIARKYGVSFNNLLDWNSLDSSLIKPGQELFIPEVRLSEHELNQVLGKLFIYPTRGIVSSRFGMRNDPFTGVRRFHNGVDLKGREGTLVKAAMSGKVAMTGYNANYGKYIILSHSEGYQTFYGHLDKFQVRKGQRVSQGQIIGEMGNTGYSTGPHLHFSIFRRGEPVDPFKYLH